MRILLVNSIVPTVWGGGEKWFVEAAAWLAAHGHVPLVVGRPGARLLEAARARHVAVESFDFGGDYDPFATARALGILIAHDADVVLSNFNKESWLFGRAASLLRRPLVMRHGLTVLRPKTVHRLLVRWHVRRIVVNARSIRDEYEQLGYDPGRIEVIPNGVAPARPRPRGTLRARHGVPAERILVVAGGRMDGQKRLDRYVDVAARIVAEGIDAHFLLLGEGAERDTLVARIEAAGLRDRFTLTGFVDDLAEVIGDGDLFLLTSRNEGTPNVLLEAMAAGVACLSFDVGAVPEILHSDLAASVIAEGHTETMAERAIALLRDPQARSDLARRQQARVRGEFSQDASMGRYLALFESLTRRGTGATA